jgi:hypothetical protein
MFGECYGWSWQTKAPQLVQWILSLRSEMRSWNYFENKITAGLSESIHRAIRGLKWQAYGYKDMAILHQKSSENART